MIHHRANRLAVPTFISPLLAERFSNFFEVPLLLRQLPLAIQRVPDHDHGFRALHGRVILFQEHVLEAVLRFRRVLGVTSRHGKDEGPCHRALSRGLGHQPVPLTCLQGIEELLAGHPPIRNPDLGGCRGERLDGGNQVLSDGAVVGVTGIDPVTDDEPISQADRGQHDLGIAGMPILVVTLHPKGRFVNDARPRSQRGFPILRLFPGPGESGDFPVVQKGLEEHAGRVDQEDHAVLFAADGEESLAHSGFDLVGMLVEHVEGTVEMMHVPTLGLGEVGIALEPLVGGTLAHGIDDAVQDEPEHQALEVEGPDAMALGDIPQGCIQAEFPPDHGE